MTITCPHCHTEMEGAVQPGDIVECPVCETRFPVEAPPAPEEPAVQVVSESDAAEDGPRPDAGEPEIRTVSKEDAAEDDSRPDDGAPEIRTVSKAGAAEDGPRPDAGEPEIRTVSKAGAAQGGWRRFRTIAANAAHRAIGRIRTNKRTAIASACGVVVLAAIVCVIAVKSGSKKQTRRDAPTTSVSTPSHGGRSFVKDHIRANDNCRIVSITKRGGDVVVSGRNNWAASGCPKGLINSLRDAADDHERITDVCLTETGRWIVLHGRNAGEWFGIPSAMELALRRFNRNNEEIYSATFNDAGDWIVISSDHYIASDTYLKDWLGNGARKYGLLRAACVSEDAAVAVFEGGYLFFGRVPDNLKRALRRTSIDVRVMKIAGGAWFFADENGRFECEL